MCKRLAAKFIYNLRCQNSGTLLELLLLAFVRSFREANFELYIDALSKMVPWFFSLDHTNYARWLPIHIRDMYRLNDVAPDVAVHFQQGNFAVTFEEYS